MKLHPSLVGAAVIGLSICLPVQATTFEFTQLSPNLYPNGLYQEDNVFGNASINNEGEVTFEAFAGTREKHSPPAAILEGSGDGSVIPSADQSSYSFIGNNSTIYFSSSTNDRGTTVLSASGYNYGEDQTNANGPTAILTSSNGLISTVVSSPGPFEPIPKTFNVPNPFDFSNLVAAGEFVSAASINNLGTVAYYGGHNGIIGLYTKDSDGKLVTIATAPNPNPVAVSSDAVDSNFKDFFVGIDVGRGNGPFAGFSLPSINDKGMVAFGADYKEGGGGIFVGNGANLSTIADTKSGFTSNFSLASLNNEGTVAFNAGLTSGGRGIFTSSDGKLTEIADTRSGLFKDFTSDVSLNNKGDVAFLADLNDGSSAIFSVGSDLLPHKLIGTGDSLDGLPVTHLFISHGGLNDQGQIVFDAVLADDSDRVFRATPVPEPSSCTGLGIALLGALGYRRRRQPRDRV